MSVIGFAYLPRNARRRRLGVRLAAPFQCFTECSCRASRAIVATFLLLCPLLAQSVSPSARGVEQALLTGDRLLRRASSGQPSATENAFDDPPPATLQVVVRPGISGPYDLVKGHTANGLPLWKRRGSDNWLFASPGGRWVVGGHEERKQDFECDTGLADSGESHGGALPHQVHTTSWRVHTGKYWLMDNSIRVDATSSTSPASDGYTVDVEGGAVARGVVDGSQTSGSQAHEIRVNAHGKDASLEEVESEDEGPLLHSDVVEFDDDVFNSGHVAQKGPAVLREGDSRNRATKKSAGNVEFSWKSPKDIYASIVGSSVSQDGRGTDMVLTPKDTTFWQSKGTPATLDFEFAIPQQLGGIRVKQPNDLARHEFLGYRLKASDDGFHWYSLGHGDGLEQQCCNYQTIEFSPVKTKFFRFMILSGRVPERDVTLSFIQFKIVHGEIQSTHEPQLLTCEFEGSFAHHQRCRGQLVAQETCKSYRLRLCSKYELIHYIGRSCEFAWTTSSETEGYRVGTGDAGCGDEGKIQSTTISSHGEGVYDAACCVEKQRKKKAEKKGLVVVHEQFGSYTLLGDGSCASFGKGFPEAEIIKNVKDAAECRLLCDKDPGCGALAWCGPGGGCFQDCYKYTRRYTYEKLGINKAFQCWVRSPKSLEITSESVAAITWLDLQNFVDSVTAEPSANGTDPRDVLYDDDHQWSSAGQAAEMLFLMRSTLRVMGVRLEIPMSSAGSGAKEFLVQYSHDGLAWEDASKGWISTTLSRDILFPVAAAQMWRIKMRALQYGNTVELRYIEFKIHDEQAACRSFAPLLSVVDANNKDFIPYVNLASEKNGGNSFGSGSARAGCVDSGAGKGRRKGIEGTSCYFNVNDEIKGADSSWQPGADLAGLHFIGVAFGRVKRIYGFRVSMPLSAAGTKATYTVQVTSEDANHTTSSVRWCTIATLPWSGPTPLYKRFTQAVDMGAMRIVVDHAKVTIDELEIFGDVHPLPITKGLVADFRSAAFEDTTGVRLWSSSTPARKYSPVHEDIAFDKEVRAFMLPKGSPVIESEMVVDPHKYPNCTWVAWLRLESDSGEAGCSYAPGHEHHGKILIRFKLRIKNLLLNLLSKVQKDKIKALLGTLAEGMLPAVHQFDADLVSQEKGVLRAVVTFHVSEKSEARILEKVQKQLSHYVTNLQDALPEILAIEVAQIGNIKVDTPEVTELPHCSLEDQGRGWVLSQAPDFGRSRALVLHDWRGEMSMNLGTTWDAHMGKPPVGHWFFFAGVFRQGGSSFVYKSGHASNVSAIGMNTGSGPYVLLLSPNSSRCISTFVDGSKISLRLFSDMSKPCESKSADMAFEWIPSGNVTLLRHASGKCWRRSGKKNPTLREAMHMILDMCVPEDPRFQFIRHKTSCPAPLPKSDITTAVDEWGLSRDKCRFALLQQVRALNRSKHTLCVRGAGKADNVPLTFLKCPLKPKFASSISTSSNNGSNGSNSSKIISKEMVLAISGDMEFVDVQRASLERFVIGGAFPDINGELKSPGITVSDVAVFKRSLSLFELSSLFYHGRPSAPMIPVHCPDVPAKLGVVCPTRERQEFCEYSAAASSEFTCFDFCQQHAAGPCLGASAIPSVGVCEVRADAGHSCQRKRKTQLCRCGASNTTKPARNFTGEIFAVGRDGVVYSQPLDSMSAESGWRKTMSCCVLSIAVSGSALYGVTKSHEIVKVDLRDVDTGASWVVVSTCCITSVAIAEPYIYGVDPEGFVIRQELATMTKDTAWLQVGLCCVTSLTLSGRSVYATGVGGEVYTQSLDGMLAGEQWIEETKADARALMVRDGVVFAVRNDDSIYTMNAGALSSPASKWTRSGDCCMRSVANGVH